MLWRIQFFPACKYHIFLSHSAEDRSRLVHPVYRKLSRQGIIPWLDLHEYPYGRSSRSALRDSILNCRHVVFFVTDAMLSQSRGWCVQELAWTELLQDNLILPGGPSLQNVLLPLFFVDQSDPRLPRSVWQSIRDRGHFCPPKRLPTEWAVDQIIKFLRREQLLANDYRRVIRRSTEFRKSLNPPSGLCDRVSKFEPVAIPDSV